MTTQKIVKENGITKLVITTTVSTDHIGSYTTEKIPNLKSIGTAVITSSTGGDVGIKINSAGDAIEVNYRNASFSDYTTTRVPNTKTTSATHYTPSPPSTYTTGGLTYSLSSTSAAAVRYDTTTTKAATPSVKYTDSSGVDALWAANAAKASKLTPAKPDPYVATSGIDGSVANFIYSLVETTGPYFVGYTDSFYHEMMSKWTATIAPYTAYYSNTQYSTSYTYYYTYTIEIPFVANVAPDIVLLNDVKTPIISETTIRHRSYNDFKFSFTADDFDADDTMMFSLWHNDKEISTWTSIERNTEVPIVILGNTLRLGNNDISIKVKDNNDNVGSVSFILRSIVPESFCPAHLKDLLAIFGNAGLDSSSLQGLKPAGYTGTTLSMSELVNYLV